MASLRIILLCVLSAVVYGILHDQVTARVCVEYFTVGHPNIFHTESPTLLAIGWGFVATWWVGLILGILAALAARCGPFPKFGAAHLVRPILCLLVVVAATSLVAGIVGYEMAKAGAVKLPESLAIRIPTAHRNQFLADLVAHQTAYAVGFLGGIVLCGWVLVQRWKMMKIIAPIGDEKPQMDAKTGFLFVCRWTARTVGIAIICLAGVSLIGEGGLNPFTLSLRDNLLGLALLTMAGGLLVGWKWEGIGALLIFGGFALFAAVNQPFRLNVVMMAWLLVGLLYLIGWWREAKVVSES